jgi:hypothetical protein
MILPTGVIAVSLRAIFPHYGNLLEIGFQNFQVASEKLLKVGHLVKDHPCVVGCADWFWHKGF